MFAEGQGDRGFTLWETESTAELYTSHARDVLGKGRPDKTDQRMSLAMGNTGGEHHTKLMELLEL